MVGQGQLLWSCVDVVDQCNVEVGLVLAVVMWTPLPEVVAETGATVPLFVRVLQVDRCWEKRATGDWVLPQYTFPHGTSWMT